MDFAAEFALSREARAALSFCLSYFSGSDRISQYPKRFPPLRSIRPADFNTSIFLCRALRDKPSLSESTDWEMLGSSLSSSNSLCAKASSKASFWAGLWRFGALDSSTKALCSAAKRTRRLFPRSSYVGCSAPSSLQALQINRILDSKCDHDLADPAVLAFSRSTWVGLLCGALSR